MKIIQLLFIWETKAFQCCVHALLTTVLTLCQDAPALLQVSDHSWSVLIQC